MFLEGGVRHTVEYGEPYEHNEILLKICMEINKEKLSEEFIGDPSKITLLQLKQFLCQNFNLKEDEHLISRTNNWREPTKPIKNERILLAQTGFEDGEYIYLKNMSSELYATYLLKFFMKPNVEISTSYVFTPINEECFVHELNVKYIYYVRFLKTQLYWKLRKY